MLKLNVDFGQCDQFGFINNNNYLDYNDKRPDFNLI